MTLLVSVHMFSQSDKTEHGNQTTDSHNLETTDMGKNRKIVFQLSHPDINVWDGLLRQLNNIKEGWPQAEMEVVVHSGAIGFLKSDNTDQAAEIRDLSRRGVVFAACENTMKRKNITPAEMIDVAKFVPMGIGEVVIKQDEGWAYIKASP